MKTQEKCRGPEGSSPLPRQAQALRGLGAIQDSFASLAPARDSAVCVQPCARRDQKGQAAPAVRAAVILNRVAGTQLQQNIRLWACGLETLPFSVAAQLLPGHHREREACLVKLHIAVAIVAAFAGAACGGDNDAKTSETPTVASSAENEALPTLTPAELLSPLQAALDAAPPGQTARGSPGG